MDDTHIDMQSRSHMIIRSRSVIHTVHRGAFSEGSGGTIGQLYDGRRAEDSAKAECGIVRIRSTRRSSVTICSPLFAASRTCFTDSLEDAEPTFRTGW